MALRLSTARVGHPQASEETPEVGSGVHARPLRFRRPSSARERLLERHLPLVERLARRLARRLPRHVLLEDLIGAGRLGLWRAIRDGEVVPGPRDDAFVRIRVLGAMLDELRAEDWLPRRTREAAERRAAPMALVWLDALPEATASALCRSTECSAEERLDAQREVARLGRAVEALPPRDRQILLGRELHGRSLADLGREHGVSQPRVSQLHARGLAALRAAMLTARRA